MPKFRAVSVDEYLGKRSMVSRDGMVYRAAKMPKSFNPEERSGVFVMTDESVDSYGDIVKAGGADLYRFEKNPIALLNHRSDMILGTWSDVQKKPQRLEGKVTLANEGTAPHIDMAFGLMSQGILKGASIGFMPTKLEMRLDDDGDPTWCYIIHEWELYECSVVSIPANPAALARSAGNSDELRIARDYIEQVLDSWVKSPEGLILPRSEFEAAHKVTVEKIAADKTAPAKWELPTRYAGVFTAEQNAELHRVAATQGHEAANAAFGALLVERTRTALSADTVQIQELSDDVVSNWLKDSTPLSMFTVKAIDDHVEITSSTAPAALNVRATDEIAVFEKVQSLMAAKAEPDDELVAFKAFLQNSLNDGDDVSVYFKLEGVGVLESFIVQHPTTDKMDKFEFAAGMTAEHRVAISERLAEIAAAKAAAPAPENKTATHELGFTASNLVLNLSADTTEVEAAVERVDGLFGRLAQKFPMFFPKTVEERVEPVIVPVEPPVPPTADAIKAARQKAEAARARLVSKGLAEAV